MKINDTTNTNLPAGALSKLLKDGLDAFKQYGGAAETFLQPIFDSEDYEIVIKSGDTPTATSGKRVTLNTAILYSSGALKADGVKEFVESAIFELNNATNSAGFATLDLNLKNGTTPVMKYGESKADLEASSTWMVKTILTLAKTNGYEPSAWGNAQVDACTGSESFVEFKVSFRDLPHDNSATEGTAAKLPTKQFYAFNGAMLLAGTRRGIERAAVIKAKTKLNKEVSLDKAKDKGLTVSEASSVNTKNHSACRFYHVCITLIAELKEDSTKWDVEWNGAQADWEFTDAMKRIVTDTGDLWKTSLKRVLTTKLDEVFKA